MKLRLHKILRNYQNTKLTNTLIHFLSNAPILGYFFHKDLVEEYEAKSGINLAINSISYLFDFFKKVIYVFILYMIFTPVNEGFAYFFLLLTLSGTIYKKINKFDFKDYDNIMLLKIDSQRYIKYKINYYIIKELILLTLALLIIAVKMNINFIFIIYLMFMYIGIHLTGEALYIKSIEKNKYEINNDKILKLAVVVIILILITICYIFEIYVINKLIYLFGVILIIGGIISYRFLINYKNYKEIHKYNLNIDVINNYKITKQNSNAQSEIIDININSMNNKINKNIEIKDKKSYEYLYSMLLKRYEKTLNGDLFLIVGITTIISLTMLVLPILIKNINPQKYANAIFNSLSMLFIIMYFISSIGKKILKLCFFQIDRYLINYNFYRTEKAIKENLKLRLKTIILKCLIPTFIISIFLALIFIIYSNKLNIIKLLIIILLPIILSLFYSLYHIATYYLFQPYAFDGTVVNKAYKALDYIVYVIVYILFDSAVVFNVKTITIITFALLIISIILYNLVKKKGIKTFRVR